MLFHDRISKDTVGDKSLRSKSFLLQATTKKNDSGRSVNEQHEKTQLQLGA